MRRLKVQSEEEDEEDEEDEDAGRRCRVNVKSVGVW